MDKMTAEQALERFRQDLLPDPHDERDIDASWIRRRWEQYEPVIRQALSAPRVPAGWIIRRGNDGAIVVQSHGIGGYAAREMGGSGIAESILYHLAEAMLAASPEPVAQTIERDSGTLAMDETGAVSKVEPKRYEDTQAARGIPAENILHDLDAALDRILLGTDEDGDGHFIRSACKAWVESAVAERDLRAEVEALRNAALGMVRIVEQFDGAVKYGTWCDSNGMRLKDTPEWVALYLAARLREGGA